MKDRDFTGRTPKKHEPKYVGKKKIRIAKDGSIIFGNNKARMNKYAIGIAVLFVIMIVLIVSGEGERFIRSFDIPEADGALLPGPITIGIYKSNSCKADVLLGGDCMSYKEMLQFDNTNQAISGLFVDDPKNNDIRRLPPMFENHWNYYYGSGMEYLFAVDPDEKWFSTRNTNIQIFVEPSSFVFFDHTEVDTGMGFGYSSKTTNKLQYIHDAYIEGCSFARVKGDPELVAKVISYFMSECSSDIWTPDDQIQTVALRSIPLDPNDHRWYSYNAWMNKALITCKIKC